MNLLLKHNMISKEIKRIIQQQLLYFNSIFFGNSGIQLLFFQLLLFALESNILCYLIN